MFPPSKSPTSFLLCARADVPGRVASKRAIMRVLTIARIMADEIRVSARSYRLGRQQGLHRITHSNCSFYKFDSIEPPEATHGCVTFAGFLNLMFETTTKEGVS